MSCAMVYWGSRYKRFENVFIRFGATVDLRHLRGKIVGAHERLSLFEVKKHPLQEARI